MPIIKFCARLFLCSMLFNLALTAQQATTTQTEATLQIDPAVAQDVSAGQQVVTPWLALIDQAQYGQSWDAASQKLQATITKAEWIKAVSSWRRPLGSVVSRQIADIRVSNNPPNMPAGKYLVFVYQTAFRNKPQVTEVVILLQTDAGQWRTLSYHLK